jgi:SAM-dependent methyltransferase
MSDQKNIEKRFDAVSRSRTFRNIVGGFSLDRKRVLDIGCSYGEFLTHFGKGSVGFTIEPNEVLYAKTKGLDVRLGNIEADECDFAGEKFDVIFANNIFEHLLSPHMFLQKIPRYLGKDGLLILGVPSVPTISLLMRFSKFRGALATQHINFFTHRTLALTVQKGGWNVSQVRSFHMRNRYLDALLHPVAPHFYVIASVNPDFSYHEKRLKELAGYEFFKQHDSKK